MPIPASLLSHFKTLLSCGYRLASLQNNTSSAACYKSFYRGRLSRRRRWEERRRDLDSIILYCHVKGQVGLLSRIMAAWLGPSKECEIEPQRKRHPRRIWTNEAQSAACTGFGSRLQFQSTKKDTRNGRQTLTYVVNAQEWRPRKHKYVLESWVSQPVFLQCSLPMLLRK